MTPLPLSNIIMDKTYEAASIPDRGGFHLFDQEKRQ